MNSIHQFGIISLILISVFSFKSVWAAEDDLYKFLWLDRDKKVYVLQNKIYRKKGQHHIDLGFITHLSSNYQDISGFKAAYGLYFTEIWGLEFFYHHYSSEDNEDTVNLRNFDDVNPLTRKLTSKLGGMLLWSPFYGKINTFNKIIYLDLYFGLGGGILVGEDNVDTVDDPTIRDIFTKRNYATLMGKIVLRVYISRSLHLNVGYHMDYYKVYNISTSEGDTGKSQTITNDVSLSMGIRF